MGDSCIHPFNIGMPLWPLIVPSLVGEMEIKWRFNHQGLPWPREMISVDDGSTFLNNRSARSQLFGEHLNECNLYA